MHHMFKNALKQALREAAVASATLITCCSQDGDAVHRDRAIADLWTLGLRAGSGRGRIQNSAT
jgi:hypothetical protein